MTEYESIKSFSEKKPNDHKMPKRAEVAYTGPGTNQCRTSRKERRKKDRLIRRLRGKSRLSVTKSLNKIAASLECKQAIDNEADALVQAGTWDEKTVCEREKLISWAKANDKQIIVGDLLILGLIKFFEKANAK